HSLLAFGAREMARRLLTNPRKNASQERSRATVDALIEATARILVREGFDSASTNRIAEKAGVSVGSLYQYFPGKEALVAAVIDRHHQETMQVVRDTLAEVPGSTGGAANGGCSDRGASHRSQAASRACGADSTHRKAPERGGLQSGNLWTLQELPR